jgi:hypothetical protein
LISIHIYLKFLKIIRKDPNTPTDKIYWDPEMRKYDVTKQAISAKKKAYIKNPKLLNANDNIPSESTEDARNSFTCCISFNFIIFI